MLSDGLEVPFSIVMLIFIQDYCFVSFLLNVPVNNLSVMSGRSHRFLGITSTFWEVNVSCSRPQNGNLSDQDESNKIFKTNA